jgi:PAS domain S-box-containing protein
VIGFNARSGRAVDHQRWPYRATIAFISLFCVVVVGHDLLRTWDDRSRQMDSVRREVANLAWAADQHAGAAFRVADASLTALVERVETDGTGAAQLERLRRVLAQRLAHSLVLASLAVVDETGALIADGRSTMRQTNVADRTYFQYHQTHIDRQPYVSGILHSRLSDKLIISVSIRLNHPDGSFAGVVVASLASAYFQDFYATLDLGHDGLVSLYRDDGVLLVRQPTNESAVGIVARSGDLFHGRLLNAPTGTFETVSTLDGVIRIVSYRRVTGYPLVVAAGLGKSQQLAVWRAGAAEHLLATVATAVLLGFISVRLVMQVQRLTRAKQVTAVATAAAEMAAARYSLIADNASDVIITADLQFIRRYVSPGCRGLLGYEPEELTGGAPFSLAHPDDAQWVAECLLEMVAGRDLDLLTYRVRHCDGHWVWVEAAIRLIRDPDTGTPLEICAALRDITRRHEVECEKEQQRHELEQSNAHLARYAEALQQSNAELDDFAYIASHDLKEPLRGLSNNARFLHEDYAEKLDQEGVNRLLRLGYLCQRMEHLIDDLLYFSRIGRQDLGIQATDLNTVIGDIETMSETTLRESNATIVIPHKLPQVSCDKPRITEVFRNLISNAVKYNVSDRKLIEIGYCADIETKGRRQTQVFYVKDNGIGIAQEFHEDIFRIFKRLNAEDENKKGTGVGLTFVRKIVERHGGRIWLDSVLGEGTTFYFTIAQGASDAA